MAAVPILIVAGTGVIDTIISKKITFTLVPGIIGGIIMFFASLYYIISSLIKLARQKEDSFQK